MSAHSRTPVSKFLYHNVDLPDGRRTSNGQLMAERAGVRQAVELLQSGIQRGGSILDLGCLEGGYSVEFARSMPESQVTGVEVRPRNFDRCERLANECGLENLSFVNEDVLDTSLTADGVFCGGLLYHLENPAQFLLTLRRMARKLVVINTHYSVEFGPQLNKLSEVVENDGCKGRWYTEFPDDETFRRRGEFPLSAWSNRRSFWLLRKEIIRRMTEVGFRDVVDYGLAFDKTGYNRMTITGRTD